MKMLFTAIILVLATSLFAQTEFVSLDSSSSQAIAVSASLEQEQAYVPFSGYGSFNDIAQADPDGYGLSLPDSSSFDVQAVPEPSALAFSGLALIAMVVARKLQQRQSS
jgi:hypothetical protein